jgi:integrase/recombinase XerD
LSYFKRFLERQGVETIEEVTANVIRLYMEELSGHRSPAGCHVPYRIIKSLTYWWEDELDGDYVSPMHRKVKPPKLDRKLLEPVDLGDVREMIDACEGPNAYRDKAILYCLLDTGARADEFISMDIKDLDIERGTIQVRYGKGNKERIVIIGKQSRKALRGYLRRRTDDCQALWITDEKHRLTYWGLRQLLRRAAERANLEKMPSLHAFRRAFVVAMLRKRVSIMTIRNLMGHADLKVLERYANQSSVELEDAYRDGSPSDLP